MIRRITGIVLGVLAFFLVYWLTGLGNPSNPTGRWRPRRARRGAHLAVALRDLRGPTRPAESPERDRPGSPEAARAAAEQSAPVLIVWRRARHAPDQRVIARAIDRFFPRLLADAPDFRRLWLGQTISVFGDQITQLGLPLVAVLTLGADAGQMGTLTAVGVLPHLLFSLPAGVWLDRVRSRRRLMVIADLGRAAIIASIPVAYALGGLSMLQLYVVGFLAGSLSVVFDLSWNTVFVSVTRARALRRGDVAAQRQPLARLRRRARPSAGCSSRCSGRRWRCWPTPCPSSARWSSSDGSARRNRPIEAEAGSIRWRLVSGHRRSSLQDPIIRPSMLAVATINLFTFAFGALFILYVTATLGRLAGGARPGARDRRGRRADRRGRRVADRAADRARSGLCARLRHLPAVAADDPAGHARTCRCRSSSG